MIDIQNGDNHMTTYEIEGKQIIRVFNAGSNYVEKQIAAYCDQPQKALDLMLKAWKLNDARKYTASARMLAQLDYLPGFQWFQDHV